MKFHSFVKTFATIPGPVEYKSCYPATRAAIDYPELVINEDDLYFFRKAGAMEYERGF